MARGKCSAPNIQYEIENAYELSYGDAVFDSVVGSSVLHHLEIEKALRDIYRVLKPDGTIYFTEPNMLNPQIAVQKNIPWIKRKLGDSPDETAFFRWPLRRLLEGTGYRDVRVEPFDFLHPKTPAPLIKGVDMLGDVVDECHIVSGAGEAVALIWRSRVKPRPIPREAKP